MTDQIKNVMIGIFVIGALGVVVFVMMFLHPNIGNEKEVIKVRFANIDKISEGTRVTYGGKPVGEVVDVQEISPGKSPREAYDGNVYIYELTLRVDSGVRVYNTDTISAKTSGLLGEKSVAITPMPVPIGEKLIPIDPEHIIYATETGSVEDTIKEFKELSDKFELALDNINDTFNDIKRNRIIDHVGSFAGNLSAITTSLNKPDEWADTLSNIHEMSENLNEVSSRANKSWDKVDTSLANVVDATNDAKIVFSNVQKGEGSVGKILVKDDMYLRISSLLSKAEITFDDINHYGLLFHNDKAWQRLRARRLNLLQKLCTPQEFRNFFNDEVDEITASLSRVAMVLSEVDPCSPCYELWDNPEYIKVYGELIRRVDMLDEYVNMFNTQIVHQDVMKTELRDPFECPCNEPNHYYYYE